jgi:hypothetical protein
VASGFLILADGRCFARRWWAYDAVIKAVAEQLDQSTVGGALAAWLLALLPGPEDQEEIGYGPWIRASDNQSIERKLDLRELTAENRALFHNAARKAGERAQSPDATDWPDWLRSCLIDLSEMVERADRGEPPLGKSDWREVVPSEGKRVGPGW